MDSDRAKKLLKSLGVMVATVGVVGGTNAVMAAEAAAAAGAVVTMPAWAVAGVILLIVGLLIYICGDAVMDALDEIIGTIRTVQSF